MSAVANKLLAAALAGAATGARSFTSLGLLALSASGKAHTQPDKALSKRAVNVPVALIALQELVMDKLPMTPSRLEPPGLASRAVGAAVSGVIIARREPEPADASGLPADQLYQPAGPQTDTRLAAACAFLAVAAAGATAWLGAQWRAGSADRIGQDWVGGAAEDLVVLGLSAVAVKLAR